MSRDMYLHFDTLELVLLEGLDKVVLHEDRILLLIFLLSRLLVDEDVQLGHVVL